MNPTVNYIDSDVIFMDNVHDLAAPVGSGRVGYNVVTFCQQGQFQAEIGADNIVTVGQGQVLVFPSNRVVRGLTGSPDVSVSVLGLSDRVLKSVLGPQVSVWNKAMYLHRVQVLDAEWCQSLRYYNRLVFQDREALHFQKEIAHSFLRTFMLLLCDQLVSHDRTAIAPGGSGGSDRERIIFDHFLQNLAHKAVKHVPVGHYARELCITPKYLCSVCSHVSGKSPSKWITEYVMDDIYTLLKNTDLTIKEISVQLGFPNQSFFGKYFRDQTGHSPAEYRQRYK